MDECSIPDHKLCGFLCAVLTVPHPHPMNLTETLIPNTRCQLFAEDSVIGFKSQNGTIFSVINSNAGALVPAEGNSTPLSSTRKKWSRIGLVHGSISVVHQLHALVNHKCLEADARFLRFETDKQNCDEIRVVLLVDVYLPIELWSGWQFPRLGSTAAALFRHLSCCWEARSSMLELSKTVHGHDDSIWNLPDCHVIGCNQHCSGPHNPKKKLFELHDIFMSLPNVSMKGNHDSSRVHPADNSCGSGIWVVSDDVLISILSTLCPLDLLRISATCRHLRFLTASIMPCMKLKLFPHQHAAVEWMLQRERVSEVLPHPLYVDFVTEDGFVFYVNTVSGEIVINTKPTVRDFHGGMFCDEPGLGKTITALSLILKTQGTFAVPPDGAQMIWCMHNGDQRCGYYEVSIDNITGRQVLSSKRVVGQTARRGQFYLEKSCSGEKLNGSVKRARVVDSVQDLMGFTELHGHKDVESAQAEYTTSTTCVVRCTRSRGAAKKNLLHRFEAASGFSTNINARESTRKRGRSSNYHSNSFKEKDRFSGAYAGRNHNKFTSKHFDYNETWVQCDACKKWRKLVDASAADTTTAWFCSMNSDTLHQSCNIPEESWDYCQSITNLPGFHTKGTSGGKEENVSFFINVLKEHRTLINFKTVKALTWLANLSPTKLSEMGRNGLLQPVMQSQVICSGVDHDFHRIFQAFSLIKREEQGTTKWYYPRTLSNLDFDVSALRIALCEPLDSVRLYLSKATLVVVPSNLVDHWNTQIQKHVRHSQLRVFIWTDNKKPRAHNLAWDYDVVITTFSRLSTEWNPRKRSVLMQVHWLRVIFDEGHTLGSSLNLTNKLQMSVSLTATSRWLLTGTPTPITPNSQLSNLQPMLKFLHEEVYGENQKSWEYGILKPFEAEMEEGRSRLLQLLRRCMISARKIDLQTIPPCIKKVTFLNFTEEHARSYNELVVTVRRNILMADWNDPSHVESLLNPKQWKFRSTTIRNVRLSCCVAGHIKVTDAGHDIQETMDILVENGLDPMSEEYAFIRFNLLYGGNCMRCNEWCRLPVVTPCKHLLCLDCVALNSESCTYPGCGNLYEMQTPEILARPENPNPKWPVPKDLIELQPSYKQDDWNPDWQSTSSSKVAYLLHRLKELLEANRKNGYCLEEAVDVKELNEDNSCVNSSNECYRTPPEKVIVFSQFLEHIHVIEQQLTVSGIKFAGMYSPMHSSNKMKSLTTFQHDASCIALVMDGSAALGLDLSFVTHVFLMEPIWDKSMEEQVISRAHRMGATRPILVETLAMNGTIEEQMLIFLQDADGCRRLLKEEFGKHDREGVRARRTLHDFAESNYLSRLSFVRTALSLEDSQPLLV